MPNATAQERYTEHGLALIRLSNGLVNSTNREIRELGRELRTLLAEYGPELSAQAIRGLVQRINRTIQSAYTAVAASQVADLRELINVEAEFAVRAASLSNSLRRAELNRIAGNVLVHGATVPDQWTRQGANFSWQVSNTLRAAHASGAPRREVVAAILGSGRAGQERGGILESVQQSARSLVDSSVQSTANAGRIASFKVEGSDVSCISWFSILDAKLCPNCGMRSNKLYTLDYKPIGHSISMVGPPPLHPFCRCILLPMKFPDGIPKNPPGQDRFENWLKKKAVDEQEELLGVGRADLWRSGKITLNQLIGQDGLVMTLEQLRGTIARVP